MQDQNNEQQPEPRRSFYQKKPHPLYDHDLYDRMRNKDMVVEIDNDFPGMQVVVFTEKKD